MLLVNGKETMGHVRLMKRGFILTNLGSLGAALNAYKQRMGIEEMFRDCKTEATILKEQASKETDLLT
jgi:hypothetical protein